MTALRMTNRGLNWIVRQLGEHVSKSDVTLARIPIFPEAEAKAFVRIPPVTCPKRDKCDVIRIE